MKNLNLLVMFFVFICMLVCIYYYYRGEGKKRDAQLNNNLFIKGRVLNIQTSNNHSFGIVLLSLDSCNFREFSTTQHDIYPYKVKNGMAELYSPIPDGIAKGDEVIINSNKHIAVYYYVNSRQRFEGSINIIANNRDINYVKQHSVLK